MESNSAMAEASKEFFKGLPPPLPPPIKQPVGRPKRPIDATSILVAASKAESSTSSTSEEHPNKRGKYTDWFESPFIREVLRAHEATGFNARQTVKNLKRAAADNRYDRLSHSTLHSWYDKENKLHERFRLRLDGMQERIRGNGPPSAFEKDPTLEAAIMSTLTSMRDKGAAINCNIIRWVMQALIQQSRPEMLEQFSLSKAFISRWAHDRLNWTWRAKTTAASKLPNDWESQGVLMAQRIAARMEMSKVSICTGCNYMSPFFEFSFKPFFVNFVSRSIHPSSSTWTKLVSILFHPLHSPTRAMVPKALKSLGRMINGKSLPALHLLLTANSFLFKSSSMGKLRAPLPNTHSTPLQHECILHTARIIGVRKRQ